MPLTPRHLRRYRQIVEVFVRHGFGVLVDQLELDQHLGLPLRWFARFRPYPDTTRAEHVRLAFEELGPTFIKLGQMLSTRPDLIPPDVIAELSRLQDSATPLPWETMRERIETELGQDVDQLFKSVDPQPLATASLAQVHAAVLPDGQPVVVKVQKPDIEPTINLDLEILNDLARLARQRTALGKIYDTEEVAQDFAVTLHAEMDYRREARNAERFQNNFQDEPRLVIPRIYWDYTTRRVLVMQRIDGVKIDDLEGLRAAGYDPRRVAIYCSRLIVKEMLEDGFFHADPHPGNFVVMPGEVIGAMDFGKVGSVDDNDRTQLVRLYISAVQQDTDRIVDQMIRMGMVGRNVERPALRRDIRRLLVKYHGAALQEIQIGEVFQEVLPIAFRHHLHLPSDLWLLTQTLGIMEGLARKLDPDFDFFAVSEPYVKRFAGRMWMPSQWAPGVVRSVIDWTDLVQVFPRQAARLLEQMEHGDIRVNIHVEDLPGTMSSLHRIANRLAISVLTAAFILALAQLIPNLDFTWPWGAVTWAIMLGFLVAILLGLWLLWNILRPGK